MNVTKGKDWLDAELDAPMVAVLGGSQTDVEILQSMVSEQGLRLFSAHQLSGAEAVSPEIVILDISDADTRVQVERRLSEIRLRWDAPIVCLVSHQGSLDLEAMATLGADDYLFKPLRMLELWNRVRVLLRRRELMHSAPLVERRRTRGRRKEDRTAEPVAKVDQRCTVDAANKSVSLEGRKLNLSPKEYELFCLLLKNKGRVLSPREILEQLWEDAGRASSADVHQYMHLLRRKVEPELSRPRWILTVRGFGYKLVIPNPG
jgi:two-component system alkaline phosphatase synthesis response regulator PhoP